MDNNPSRFPRSVSELHDSLTNLARADAAIMRHFYVSPGCAHPGCQSRPLGGPFLSSIEDGYERWRTSAFCEKHDST